MKPLIYALLIVLIGPVQASFLGLFSLGGITPDLALVLLYIIGLLTGPGEAAIAGIAIGLSQDISSASFLGLTGLTKGLVGFSAGVLGTRVLDITSPSNGIFIVLFSLLESMCISIFIQIYYGSVPFFSVVAGRVIPQAIYTGAIGIVSLHFLSKPDIITKLLRRDVRKEL